MNTIAIANIAIIGRKKKYNTGKVVINTSGSDTFAVEQNSHL